METHRLCRVLMGVVVGVMALSGGVISGQNLQWGKGLPDTGTLPKMGIDTEHDAAGNIYTLGKFNGTVDFDHGPGSVLLSSTGSYDLFVLKTDDYGNFLWVRTFGSVNEEIPGDLELDAAGHVYVTGSFAGITDFDGGPGSVIRLPTATSDIFLLKLDVGGNFLDVDQYGTTGNNIGNALAVDTAGNVLLTGTFRGTIDFDPGPGVTSLVSAGTTTYTDAFVQKTDAAGNFVWAKRIGANGFEQGNAVDTDVNGDVVIGGEFQQTVDFDPGTATFNMTALGSSDAYVLKWSAAGNFIWAKRMGGSSGVFRLRGLEIGNDGRVASCGIFSASGDFDPGPGVVTLTSAGADDMYVQVLDAGGNLVWVRGWGGTSYESANKVGFDAAGQVYFAGSYSSYMDFDASPTATLNVNPSSSSTDGFVECLDTAGNFVWFGNIAGILNDQVLGLDVYADGTTVFTGRYGTIVDCDPGIGYYALQPQGGNASVFLIKWGPCPASHVSIQVQACDSFAYHGSTYSATGTYEKVLLNQANCDSFVLVDLEIKASSSSSLVVDTCGPYWLNGLVYSSSGTYTQVIPNRIGCDSIITLQLTTRPNSATTIVDSSCTSYTLNGQMYTQSGTYTQVLNNAVGCDSVITLHYTALKSVRSRAISACDSFLFEGQMIDSSGYYSAQYVNQYGCDSIEAINLTIVHLDATVTLSGDTLTAGPDFGIYQWVDCDANDSPIPGATAQYFVPSVSGNYAAMVSYGPCTERTDCVPVTLVGRPDAVLRDVKCFPVPTRDRVTLRWGNVDDAEIALYDMYGARLQHWSVHQQSECIVELPYAAGLYFLRVQTPTGSAVVKAIRE